MFIKWNNEITKPARQPLNLGKTLTRNCITSWSGLSVRSLAWPGWTTLWLDQRTISASLITFRSTSHSMPIITKAARSLQTAFAGGNLYTTTIGFVATVGLGGV